MSLDRVGDLIISPREPRPLYQQVKDYLGGQILKGLWKPDQKIPSERELCASFGLSRTTVRQALNEAVSEGLLYRVQGKGTFVADRMIDQPLFKITSFQDTVRARGMEPGLRVHDMRYVAADFRIARLLHLDVHQEVIRIEAVGLADAVPMVFYTSYVPTDVVGAIGDDISRKIEEGDLFSIFELYARTVGIQVLTADQTFESTAADDRLARHLEVPVGTPVFVVTSIVSTEKGQPVEFRRASYRGDKYKFHVRRDFVFRDRQV